jgi:hypothetical protein
VADDPDSESSIQYSNIHGSFPGTGNIDADPLFVDADGRLPAGSPVIDAGSNAAVPNGITTDLDGNPRFVDDPGTPETGNGDPPVVDMGAYEFQGTNCPWDCAGGDGEVTAVDFFALIAEWGMIGTPCDLGLGSPGVDVGEFFELLAHWGPCPRVRR